MKNSLVKQLHKRLFIFANKQFYRFSGSKLEPCSTEHVSKVVMPIVIIGKEHYQETTQRYPVNNISDLNEILKYNKSKVELLGMPTFTDDHCTVPQFTLDTDARAVISDYPWSVWMPESWALNIPQKVLHSFSRADSELYAINLVGDLKLTIAKGPFKSKHYFLMSIGADYAQEVINEEDSYIQAIYSGIANIPKSLIINIVKAQNFPHKLARKFDWLSISGGLVCGVLLFQTAFFAYLSVKESVIDKEIREQNVVEVVKKQKRFEQVKTSLEAVQRGGFDKSKVFNLWDVLLTLMENKTGVLRVTSLGDKYEIYLEAKVATETLEMLRDLNVVSSANFSTAVRQSLSNERFGVTISLDSSKGDK